MNDSDDGPAADEPLEGGCLCRAVRYRVVGAPIDAGYCHCRLCQQSSGAPVLAWFTVAIGSFAYVKGEPRSYDSSARGRREFCPDCGTPLVFRRPGRTATVDVTIASLDVPARVRPEYHIWRSSRIPWFDTVDSLPRHDHEGPDIDE